MAEQARINQDSWRKDQTFTFVQFDDLETFEHSKCKPVSVTLMVNKERKIIAYKVSRIPAKGHLVRLAQRKYGYRKNESFRAREELFESVKPHIDPGAEFSSDQHPHYQSLMKKHFPFAKYQNYKSERAAITGQGELKKKQYDPLFKINHTFAMMRANINRLVRKTWCTTKCIKALDDHIAIYVNFHNEFLT